MQYLFEYTDTLNSPYEAFEVYSSMMVFPIRPHWHYFMEIIYMKSGTGLVECDGSTFSEKCMTVAPNSKSLLNL